MEKSLPNQKEEKMQYDEYGDRIDDQEEMDQAFRLLAEDQELDEDDLRDNLAISFLVKEFVLDIGVTWDDLVAACDEKFGTLESRVEQYEQDLVLLEKINEMLKDGQNEKAYKLMRNGDSDNEA